MPSFYEDPYGILSLVSGQPLAASIPSRYPIKKVEAKPIFGWMLLKKGSLFTKNVFKCCQAYSFFLLKRLVGKKDSFWRGYIEGISK